MIDIKIRKINQDQEIMN